MVTEYCFSGEVARRAGISRETLLKWESRGIIEPAQRIRVGPGRLDRVYTSADVERVIQLATERGVGHGKEGIAA